MASGLFSQQNLQNHIKQRLRHRNEMLILFDEESRTTVSFKIKKNIYQQSNGHPLMHAHKLLKREPGIKILLNLKTGLLGACKQSCGT